jgi:glycosyltransferase involved in cell wall biosynthesis
MEVVAPFCSIIIPTIGRSSLNNAVESVVNQTIAADCWEVIVVNDSGTPLEADWQNVGQVHLINTNRHERSVARNTGAAVAQGRYLCFLDDDDYLLPNALQNLWELAQSSGAAWLYGGTQIVNRQAKPILQLHHGLSGNSFLPVLAGEWIPLQASLIRADAFFAVGGFNPLLTGPEDIDLLRRIALRYDLAEASAVVTCLAMGQDGSTTDYDRHPERSRWAREMILADTGVFERLQAGATSSFWHGRLVRIYLTSAVWNLQHKRWLTAVSRLMHALYAITRAGSGLFSSSFWPAVLKSYQSEAFSRGQREAEAT